MYAHENIRTVQKNIYKNIEFPLKLLHPLT